MEESEIYDEGRSSIELSFLNLIDLFLYAAASWESHPPFSSTVFTYFPSLKLDFDHRQPTVKQHKHPYSLPAAASLVQTESLLYDWVSFLTRSWEL